jgi:hypothetical protein
MGYRRAVTGRGIRAMRTSIVFPRQLRMMQRRAMTIVRGTRLC